MNKKRVDIAVAQGAGLGVLVFVILRALIMITGLAEWANSYPVLVEVLLAILASAVSAGYIANNLRDNTAAATIGAQNGAGFTLVIPYPPALRKNDMDACKTFANHSIPQIGTKIPLLYNEGGDMTTNSFAATLRVEHVFFHAESGKWTVITEPFRELDDFLANHTDWKKRITGSMGFFVNPSV
jgi:hypothetical protein